MTEVFYRYVENGVPLSKTSKLLLEEMILKKGYDVEGLVFLKDDNGKPYIKNCPFFYNISHVEGIVVVAISEQEVGVDVEAFEKRFSYINKKERLERLLQKIATANEKEKIHDNIMKELQILWTKKESYLKRIGTGIRVDLKQIDTTTNWYHVEQIEPYTITVNLEKEEEVRFFNV